MEKITIQGREYPVCWKPGSDRYLGQLMGHKTVNETKEALMSLDALSSHNKNKLIKNLDWEHLDNITYIIMTAIYTGVKVEQREGKDIKFDLDKDIVYECFMENPTILAVVIAEILSSKPIPIKEGKEDDKKKA